MHSKVTPGNNAALCNWNLQRGLILSVFTTAHTKKANHELCEGIDILISLIVVISSPHVHVYQIIKLYTLHMLKKSWNQTCLGQDRGGLKRHDISKQVNYPRVIWIFCGQVNSSSSVHQHSGTHIPEKCAENPSVQLIIHMGTTELL